MQYNAQYLAVQHTEENDGSKGIPVIGWGAFPTVDETAKIAVLLGSVGKLRRRPESERFFVWQNLGIS